MPQKGALSLGHSSAHETDIIGISIGGKWTQSIFGFVSIHTSLTLVKYCQLLRFKLFGNVATINVPLIRLNQRTWTLKKKKNIWNGIKHVWYLENYQVKQNRSQWKESLRPLKVRTIFSQHVENWFNIQPILWFYSLFKKEPRAAWQICNFQWICQGFNSTFCCLSAFLFMKPILHSHDTACLCFFCQTLENSNWIATVGFCPLYAHVKRPLS